MFHVGSEENTKISGIFTNYKSMIKNILRLKLSVKAVAFILVDPKNTISNVHKSVGESYKLITTITFINKAS